MFLQPTPLMAMHTMKRQYFFTLQHGSDDSAEITMEEPGWSLPDFGAQHQGLVPGNAAQHQGLVPGNLVYPTTHNLGQLFTAGSPDQDSGAVSWKKTKIPCRYCGKLITKSNISRHINNLHKNN